MTECRAAISRELEYFGFADFEEEKAIAQATLDGGRAMGTISSNYCDKLDDMDKEIACHEKQVESLGRQKIALRIAHGFFMRASGFPSNSDQFEVEIFDKSEQHDISTIIREEKKFLDESLKEYGLKIVQLSDDDVGFFGPDVAKVVLERIPTV